MLQFHAVFKVYARLIRDGKASSDTEILRLTKTLQKKSCRITT